MGLIGESYGSYRGLLSWESYGSHMCVLYGGFGPYRGHMGVTWVSHFNNLYKGVVWGLGGHGFHMGLISSYIDYYY